MFKNSNSLFNYYSKRKIKSIDSLPSQYGDAVYSGRFVITFSDNSKMYCKTYLRKRTSLTYRFIDYVKGKDKKTFYVSESNDILYKKIANYELNI